ncbi:MAG: hypothetical protein ABIA63_02240 [bacterium]
MLVLFSGCALNNPARSRTPANFILYGNENNDELTGIVITKKNEYLAIGQTLSLQSTGCTYLIKISEFGVQDWDIRLQSDLVNDVCEDNNGDLIVMGAKYQGGNGLSDLQIMRISALNNSIIFSKTFKSKTGLSVTGLSGGGFAAAGYTSSFGKRDTNGFILIVGEQGDSVCDTTFFSEKYLRTVFTSVDTIDGSGFIFGGRADYINKSSDALLVKIDTAGGIQWSETYDGSGGNDMSFYAETTSDGGFIMVGETWSSGDQDIYLVKTDSSGNKLWSREFGGSGNEAGNHLSRTADGGFIICGWTTSLGAGEEDVYLIKTDNSGNTQWQKTYGGSGTDMGYSVVIRPSGGYAVVGKTVPDGRSDTDGFLLLIDENGDGI